MKVPLHVCRPGPLDKRAREIATLPPWHGTAKAKPSARRSAGQKVVLTPMDRLRQ
jgi:hypothetical protein